jgi:hypothetical protein
VLSSAVHPELVSFHHPARLRVIPLDLLRELLPGLGGIDLAGYLLELGDPALEFLPGEIVKAIGVVGKKILLLEHRVVGLLPDGPVAARETGQLAPEESEIGVEGGGGGLAGFTNFRSPVGKVLGKSGKRVAEERSGALGHEQ